MDTITSLTNLGQSMGWPAVILAILLLVFWQIARWAKPYADKFANAVIDLVTAVRVNNDTNTATQSSLAENQKRMTDTQDSMRTLLERMDVRPQIVEIHQGVGQLVTWGKEKRQA